MEFKDLVDAIKLDVWGYFMKLTWISTASGFLVFLYKHFKTKKDAKAEHRRQAQMIYDCYTKLGGVKLASAFVGRGNALYRDARQFIESRQKELDAVSDPDLKQYVLNMKHEMIKLDHDFVLPRALEMAGRAMSTAESIKTKYGMI